MFLLQRASHPSASAFCAITAVSRGCRPENRDRALCIRLSSTRTARYRQDWPVPCIIRRTISAVHAVSRPAVPDLCPTLSHSVRTARMCWRCVSPAPALFLQILCAQDNLAALAVRQHIGVGCRQVRQGEHAIQHRTQRPLVDRTSEVGGTALAALQRLFRGARPERDADKPQAVSGHEVEVDLGHGPVIPAQVVFQMWI